MDERLTVSEAAQHLGLTTEAVRQRIRRNALRSEKIDGRLYVVLTRSDNDQRGTAASPNTGSTGSDNGYGASRALIEQLRQENERLWSELSRRDEEIHRRDVLLREALDWRSAIAAGTQHAQSAPPTDVVTTTPTSNRVETAETPARRRLWAWLSR